jgi:hypothetical protein
MMIGVSDQIPTLPVSKAFVVQFTRETTSDGETFSGRVEHMSSGRRARFTSALELVAVLVNMLNELGREPDSIE